MSGSKVKNDNHLGSSHVCFFYHQPHVGSSALAGPSLQAADSTTPGRFYIALFVYPCVDTSSGSFRLVGSDPKHPTWTSPFFSPRSPTLWDGLFMLWPKRKKGYSFAPHVMKLLCGISFVWILLSLNMLCGGFCDCSCCSVSFIRYRMIWLFLLSSLCSFHRHRDG